MSIKSMFHEATSKGERDMLRSLLTLPMPESFEQQLQEARVVLLLEVSALVERACSSCRNDCMSCKLEPVRLRLFPPRKATLPFDPTKKITAMTPIDAPGFPKALEKKSEVS